MEKRTKIIALIILLMIMGGIGYSVYRSRQVPVPVVSVQAMDRGELSSVLLSTGKITSGRQITYQGPNLTVKGVYVEVGQRVEVGDLLMEFDTQDLETAIKQAELQRKNAVLNRDSTKESISAAKSAKANMEKQVKTLTANLAVSRERQAEALKDPLNIENIAIIAEETQKISAYEAALAQIQQSLGSIPTVSSSQLELLDNAVAAADLAVETAQNRLNGMRSKILAEFAGVVTEVNATVNSVATMGVNVLTVKDDRDLNVTLNLGKYDASKVKLMQEAKIVYGDNEFSGRVVFINPAASSGTGSLGALGGVATGGESTLGVEISITDPRDIIMDFEADVEILLEKKSDVLRIPVESILYKSQDIPYVYVVENGILIEKEVVLGLVTDSYLECLEGLSEGELVVLNPMDTLRGGDQVVIDD